MLFRSGRLNLTKLAGVGFAGVTLLVLASSVAAFGGAQTRQWGGAVAEGYGNVGPIGLTLMTEYVLPFEMASVLLLVGIVGAVVVAKRRL